MPEQPSSDTNDVTWVEARAAAGASQAPIPAGGERYQLGEQLGQGGMGVVLLARDRGLGREVAIKQLLRPEHREAHARFVQEARLTGQLEHPNIVPVHELGVDEAGRPFLVMKRVKGRTLQALLDSPRFATGRRQRPLAQLLEIYRKVCDAIAYAHSQGVIHRDLKPENVMVGEFGEVLLMDWGLAKLADAEESTADLRALSETLGPTDLARTLEGEIKGTPAFMAPEQATGGSVGRAADIYGLGGLLYAILTGQPPHGGSSLFELIHRVSEGQLTPPSAVVDDVPDELEAVVLRAMATRPEARYASATALRDDVDAFLEGRLLRAASYSPLARLRKWLRRNRAAALGVAASVLIAALGVMGALALRERGRLEASAAQRRQLDQQLSSREAALAAIERELTEIAATEPERALLRLAADRERLLRAAEALAGDDQLQAERPQASARARAIPARLAELRQAAWRARIERAVTAPVAGPRQPVERLQRELAAAREASAELRPLPISRLSLWLARAAFARERPDEARRWIASAFAAQPRSAAAARGVLLLAERSLADGDPLRAASQFQRALPAIEREQPGLRGRAYLGLAQALASLPHTAMTPFAPDVPAREMALRSLLRVVDPAGQLRSRVGRETPAELQPALRQRAADWLFVLRHCAAGEAPPAGMLEQLPGGLLLTRRDGVMDVLRLEHPSSPGLRGWRLRPLNRSVTRDDMPGVQIKAAFPQRPRDGYSEVVLVNMEPDGEAHLAAYDRLTGEYRLRWIVRTKQPPVAARVGDLDGDGREDLVVAWSRHAPLMAFFGDGRGSFSQQLVLAPAKRMTSFTSALDVVDLDGDGKDEVLLGLQMFNHLSVHLISAGDRRSRELHRELTGCPRLAVTPGANRPLVVITSRADAREERACKILRRVPPTRGLACYQLRGGKLVEVGARHRCPRDGYDNTPLIFRGPGAGAVVVGSGHPTHGRYPRSDWLFYERFPEGPPRVVSQLGNRLSGTAFAPTQSQLLIRPLRDVDLAAAGRLSVPLPREDSRHPAVAAASFLIELGLEREGALAARRAMQRGGLAAEVELALARLEVAGLAGASRWQELSERLDALELSAELAADVLLAVDRLATVGGRHRDAARIARRWSQIAALGASLREAGAARASREAALAALWASPSLLLEGGQLTIAGAPTPLAERLVATDPDLLAPGDGGRLLRLRSPAAAPGGRRRFAFVGLPLRMEGGACRLTLDLRIGELDPESRLYLGLRDLDDVGAPPRMAFHLRTHGTNQRFRAQLELHEASAALDPLLGRWLRLEITSLPTGQLRMVLGDIERRRVLWVAHRQTEPLAAGRYLLTLAEALHGTSMQVDLRRLAICGRLSPLAADDPALARLLAEGQAAAVSRALGARLAGRDAEAADALLALANALRQPTRSAAEQRRGIAWALEAAWWRSPTRQALLALAPALPKAAITEITRWALTRPETPAYAGAPQAAGALIARLARPGASPEQLEGQLLPLVNASGCKPADALAALWLQADGPSAQRSRLAIGAVHQGCMAMTDRSARRGLNLILLGLLDRHPQLAREEPVVQLRAMALLALMRRREALALTAGRTLPAVLDDLADVGRRMEAQVQERRREELEAAARSGVAFPGPR